MRAANAGTPHRETIIGDEAASAKAKGLTVENRAEPVAQTSSLQVALRLDIKLAGSGGPPPALPEVESSSFAASGRCYLLSVSFGCTGATAVPIAPA